MVSLLKINNPPSPRSFSPIHQAMTTPPPPLFLLNPSQKEKQQQSTHPKKNPPFPTVDSTPLRFHTPFPLLKCFCRKFVEFLNKEDRRKARNIFNPKPHLLKTQLNSIYVIKQRRMRKGKGCCPIEAAFPIGLLNPLFFRRGEGGGKGLKLSQLTPPPSSSLKLPFVFAFLFCGLFCLIFISSRVARNV